MWHHIYFSPTQKGMFALPEYGLLMLGSISAYLQIYCGPDSVRIYISLRVAVKPWCHNLKPITEVSDNKWEVDGRHGDSSLAT